MRLLTLSLVLSDGLIPGERPAAIEAVVRGAWLPLFEALSQAPGIRAAAALSGTALAYAMAEVPALVRLIGELAQRGQVELLTTAQGAGALSLLPERDALAQVLAQQTQLREVAAVPIRGLWAGSATWNPALPALMARAGLLYTFADAGLFAAAGLPEASLGGWYLTDRAGVTAGLFPLDRRLPAWFPEGNLAELGAALHQLAQVGGRQITVPLRVEALGALPGSQAHCWTGDKPWMPRLLRMVARNAGWLKTTVPFLAFDRLPPVGRAWPLNGSHPELGALALPAASSRALMLAHELDLASPRAQSWQPPVIGPPVEMLLARRDEANRLHKATLRLSAALHAQRKEGPRSELLEGAAQQLLRALPEALLGPLIARSDLRAAAWRALSEVERALVVHSGDRSLRHEVVDADCDGQPEIIASNPAMSLVLRPATGGVLSEWSLFGVGNVVNTFTRIEERWFDLLADSAADLPEIEEDWTEEVPPPPPPPSEEDSEPWSVPPEALASPPELASPIAVEPGLLRLLSADRHKRVALHDRFLGPEATLQNAAMGQQPEVGDFVDQPYRVDRIDRLEEGDLRVVLAREGAVALGERHGLVQMVKTFLLHRSEPLMQVSWELSNRSADPLRTRFAVELNFNVDGSLAPERSLFVAGPGMLPLHSPGEQAAVSDLALLYPDLGLQLRLRAGGAPTLWHFPLAAPALGPDGIYAAPQGHSLLLVWELHLWGNEKKTMNLALRAVKR